MKRSCSGLPGDRAPSNCEAEAGLITKYAHLGKQNSD